MHTNNIIIKFQVQAAMHILLNINPHTITYSGCQLSLHFSYTIIHDHDKTYYSYGSSHQECLAHVLRYLVGAIESEPNLKWHKQTHGLLQKMIHTSKHNKSGIPNDKIKSLTDKYDAIEAAFAK